MNTNMKTASIIKTGRIARNIILGGIAAAAFIAANIAGAAGPHIASAGNERFGSLDSAVAAGALAPEVLTQMTDSGEADALVAFESAETMARAHAATPDAADRAEQVMRKASREFAQAKDRAFGPHGGDVDLIEEYDNLSVSFRRFRSPRALLAVLNAPGVAGVTANTPEETATTQSLPLINQPQTATAGYTGAGTYVAVLDTGVDYRHADFGSCTAANTPASTCRVSQVREQVASDGALDDDGHGTNVASIVSRVAPGAKIIAIDVFLVTGTNADGTPKRTSAPSDQLNAITWLISQKRAGINIVAMNLSLGTKTASTGACTDDRSFGVARSLGIIPVVSTGNAAYAIPGNVGTFTNGISTPACIPSALSVGAVYDSNVGSYTSINSCTDAVTSADKITCFSQSGPNLTMLAPGTWIRAAATGGGSSTVSYSGTSQAAPHVAGAVAVLAAAKPSATAGELQTALSSSGPRILDARNNVTKGRLDLYAAVRSLIGTVPVCAFYSPTRTDFFSTTNASQCAQSSIAPDYRPVTSQMRILSAAFTPPANTVALYNWWNGAISDNRIMRADVWACPNVGTTTVAGFTCFRHEGFSFKTPQTSPLWACSETVPASSSFSTKSNDYAFAWSSAPPVGYANQYALGHVIATFC